jgi:hypothetical protein
MPPQPDNAVKSMIWQRFLFGEVLERQLRGRRDIDATGLLGRIRCLYFSGTRRRFALCSKANIDPGSSWRKEFSEPSELDDVLGG